MHFSEGTFVLIDAYFIWEITNRANNFARRVYQSLVMKILTVDSL